MPMKDAYVQALPGIPASRGAEWVPRKYWNVPTSLAKAMAAPTGGPQDAIEAYVNEGRWVVSCPNCAGAQYACRTDHRFMCVECGNDAIAGKWRPVVWPVTAADIEAELEKRTRHTNRNWMPGETVADLAIETMTRSQPPPAATQPPDRTDTSPPVQLPPSTLNNLIGNH